MSNGTTRSGLATRTGDYLMDQGFNVVKISSADRGDYRATQILVSGDKKGTAGLLAGVLRLGPEAIVDNPVPTPASTPTAAARANPAPDIKILLGQDFSLP